MTIFSAGIVAKGLHLEAVVPRFAISPRRMLAQ